MKGLGNPPSTIIAVADWLYPARTRHHMRARHMAVCALSTAITGKRRRRLIQVECADTCIL